MQNMPLFLLVATAVGGVAWVFLYPILSGEQKAEKRKQSVVRSAPTVAARTSRSALKPRREQIEATLKQVEDRRAKSASLAGRIAQAGLNWSKQRFFITSGLLGGVALILALLLDAGWLPALGFAFAAGFGLPRWLLRFFKKRRYITSPQYIELLWTHPTGRLMLAACGVWMLMGVLVMRKMINFDF